MSLVPDGHGNPRHLGAVKKKLEPNKNELILTGGAGIDFPPNFDHRAELPILFDQLASSTCTANMGVLNYMFETQEEFNLSPVISARRFLYDVTRVYEGTPLAQDDGATIAGTFAAMSRYGICIEDLCPFDTQKLAEPPSDDAYNDAKDNRAVQFARAVGVSAIKAALMRNHILGFGLDVPEQMMGAEVAKTGVIPWIDGQKTVGGHAITIFGWKTLDDGTERLLIRNSWGSSWGQYGDCEIDTRFWLEGLASDVYYLQKVSI